MAIDVLVVDDSAVMRSIIIRTLRLSGLPLGKIYQAGNGAEGLQLLAQQRVDLALVDVHMPVMSGEEMIDRLRLSPATAHLPVVVISTEGGEGRVEQLRQKDVALLRKPFAPEALRATIDGALGRPAPPSGGGQPWMGRDT
jgi:two-component system chemotaxis response regulator CheY